MSLNDRAGPRSGLRLNTLGRLGQGRRHHHVPGQPAAVEVTGLVASPWSVKVKPRLFGVRQYESAVTFTPGMSICPLRSPTATR